MSSVDSHNILVKQWHWFVDSARHDFIVKVCFLWETIAGVENKLSHRIKDLSAKILYKKKWHVKIDDRNKYENIELLNKMKISELIDSDWSIKVKVTKIYYRKCGWVPIEQL